MKWSQKPNGIPWILLASLRLSTVVLTLLSWMIGGGNSSIPSLSQQSLPGWIGYAQGCCNLSAGVAFNVRFTTNGMCAKNNTHIFMAQTSNNRVIMACDFYCCLLPQCEALHTCRSGFPIETGPTRGTLYPDQARSQGEEQLPPNSKSCTKNFVIQKRYKNTTLYYIRMLR